MNCNYDKYLKHSQFSEDPHIRSRTPLTTKNILQTKNDCNLNSKSNHIQKTPKYKQRQIKQSKNVEENQISFTENSTSQKVSSENGKKQNARSRGFNLRVNNIQNINEKIISLLNMVKKDKFAEKIEFQDKEKEVEKLNFIRSSGKKSSPNVRHIDQLKRVNIPPFDRQSILDRIQEHKFETFQTGKQQQYKEGKFEFENRGRKVTVLQQQPTQFEDYRQMRQRYRPTEAKRQSRGTEAKLDQNTQQNEFKRTQNNLKNVRERTPKKQEGQRGRQLDRLLEERRKQRQQDRLQDNKMMENTFVQDSISRKWNHEKIQSKLSKIDLSTQNRDIQRSLYEFERHQASKFEPVDLDEDYTYDKTEKINTTTRLIDQQIKRIKSKIQESQKQNIKLQKKLGSSQNQQICGTQKMKYISPEKRKVQNISTQNEKELTTRLALKICSQVQIDLRLRPFREAFQKIEGEQKWAELKSQLESKGMSLSSTFLGELIKMSPDEFNPFGNDQIKLKDISQLSQAVYQAQSNWENYVCHCVSLKNLKQEGFVFTDLDLKRKGYLSMEDIVCFANLYTGNFYRNRDLALLFRRIQLQSGQNGQTLSFSNFQNILTS